MHGILKSSFRRHPLVRGLGLASTAAAMLAADMVMAEGLEEVVVSARKREESLQAVPLAVSAISSAQLERSFLNDSTALAQFAPNVVLDKVEAGTAGGAAFSIRGISYQDVEKGFDPTVLVFVDDVALGTGTGNVMNLLDVDSIEILRGPQGTLFGKNAVGGIINIHRKKPKLNNVSGTVRATAGNFDTKNFEGYFNYGGDTAALKLTAAHLDHSGYYKNRTTGKDEDDRTELDYGLHGLWQPAESLTLQLQGNHIEQEGTPNPILNISDRSATDGSGDAFCAFYGQCSSGPGKSQSGDPQVAIGEHDTDLTLRSDSYIGRADWDMSEQYALTYIGAFLQSYDQTEFDFDGSPLPLYSARKPSHYWQRSHELRVTRNDPIFSGQAGLYYWNSNSYSVNYGPGLVDRAGAKSESYSVYGESDFRFADRFVLTTGLRYIEEEKQIDKFVDDGAGTVAIPDGTRGKRTDDAVIYRLGLRYEISTDDMVYATYSTGFRSGGFSPRAATIEVLQKGQDPEKLTNYEVGAKTRWLDNRLQLNAALFHMIYEDMQIETSLPASNGNGQQQGFDNVGKATIDGVELELLAQITDNWTLSGNIGLLDAKYDSFFTDLYSEGTPHDFSNLDLRRAPKTSYSIASDYKQPIGPGVATLHVAYNWRSHYEDTLNNQSGTDIDAFGVLDASLGYDYENWSAALFGRNLTDETAYSHTFAVVPNAQGGTFWKFATPRQPRTFGVQLTWRFGE
jgi:iron complex outermembrane recepter protein